MNHFQEVLQIKQMLGDLIISCVPATKGMLIIKTFIR